MRVYMDHAATTPVDPRVVEAMEPFYTLKYGNPSSLYTAGQEAREAVEKARSKVAELLSSESKNIIFTSGGTESNNLALKGVALANRKKGKHIITTKIEHHAVLEPCEWLARHGFDVTYLPVDKHGVVDPGSLEKALRKETILVSIMHANNEIGTIEPISELAELVKDHDAYFHTDAVQSFGKIPVDVKKMKVDLLSMSSHKIYGPKGVGALFVRRGVRMEPLFHGGGHEFRKRSGTENVPGIVGFGKASEIAGKEMRKEAQKLTKLRDRLIKGALAIENSRLNGHPKQRLPNNANIVFLFVEGESLILELDFHGISANTGSACSSKTLEPSHVLSAIGLKPEETHGSLRLTLGRQNTREEVDYVLEVLPQVIERLRQISPFKTDFVMEE
jgi:cysteine desulfurase